MKNFHSYISHTVSFLSEEQIYAQAEIKGTDFFPDINGCTAFYRHTHEKGIFVVSAIFGLPDKELGHNGVCSYEINLVDRQKSSLLLPHICGNGGLAFSLFYTEEIHTNEIIGGTVAILRSKNSLEQLACGLILPAN